MFSKSSRLIAVLTSVLLSGFGLIAPDAAIAVATPCETTSTTLDSGVTVVTIATTGDCVWQVPAGVTSVEYLVVAGGGGGGGGGARVAACNLVGTPAALVRFGGGGAGGGGGAAVSGQMEVTPLAEISVQVGVGGAAGSPAGCVSGFATGGTAGGTGGNSSFGETVAQGGTGGSGGPDNGAAGANGGNTITPDDTFVGGTQSLSSQDCNFDTTSGCFAAPGGAGAGENGDNPILPDGKTDIYMGGGNGGDGFTWYEVTYGGGGGGGVRHCYSQPHDGLVQTNRQGGIGGAGGGGDGSLVACPSGSPLGTAGVDGLGGGGGGGRGNGSTALNQVNAGSGGKGGNGSVVIRYTAITSTLKTYEVSKDLVHDGENIDFLINGSSTDEFTFYGCYEDLSDGVSGTGQIPGAELWVGGTYEQSNSTSSPIHKERKFWYSFSGTVPTDCSWVTGEPDLYVEWTVLPSNYDCVDVGYLGDGESTEVGGVTVTATMNETLNFASVPGSYWLDAVTARGEFTLTFEPAINSLGFTAAANADSSTSTHEVIAIEGRDASENTTLTRTFDNENGFDLVYADSAVTELTVAYSPEEGEYASLLNICLLASIAPPAQPEVSGTVSKVKLDSASLNWSTVNSENVTSYKVMVNGKLVDTLDAAATGYVLRNLSKNTLYVIQIIPVTEDGDGAPFTLRFHTPNQIQKRIRFDAWKWQLKDSEIAKLKLLIKSLPAGSTNVKIQIVGRVKMDRDEPTEKAFKLAAARSKVVASRLKKFGLKGKYVLKTDVVNNWFVDSFRVAGVTVTYTPPLPQD